MFRLRFWQYTCLAIAAAINTLMVLIIRWLLLTQ
jgi:hypothetical protein